VATKIYVPNKSSLDNSIAAKYRVIGVLKVEKKALQSPVPSYSIRAHNFVANILIRDDGEGAKGPTAYYSAFTNGRKILGSLTPTLISNENDWSDGGNGCNKDGKVYSLNAVLEQQTFNYYLNSLWTGGDKYIYHICHGDQLQELKVQSNT